MNSGEGWTDVAGVWAESWGPAARPVYERLLDVARVEAGADALDVGCGTGEMLSALAARGARVSGMDPAVGMVDRSRLLVPDADVREAAWEVIPWPDDAFDVVTAVNSLQFADDTLGALAEARRVARPGGLVVIANWADRVLSDLDTIDAALAVADGDDPAPDGDLRLPGGLEAVVRDVGLDVVEAGTVVVPWRLEDDASLVRAVLLDDDASDDDGSYRDVVLRAAELFRQEDGGYVLSNTFRYVVARTTGGIGDERGDE